MTPVGVGLEEAKLQNEIDLNRRLRGYAESFATGRFGLWSMIARPSKFLHIYHTTK